MIHNALSVDLEEYYHGLEFEAALGPDRGRHLPSRVEWSTERVLGLLGRREVHATFFAVGSLADAHPALIRHVAAAGHEIACHGYAHELVSRQEPEAFRADVRRAKAVLEDLVGGPVLGYRAPNYSIGSNQSWAWEILLEEGFAYDSSVYPIRHDRYGDPNAPRFPYEIARREERGLTEFPIGTLRLGANNWPIGGGGIFRLFPAALFELAVGHVNRREGRPVMFYFHPWELDPHQPRPRMPLLHRFRHYVNIARFEQKLDRFVSRVSFAPARRVLGLVEATPAPLAPRGSPGDGGAGMPAPRRAAAG